MTTPSTYRLGNPPLKYSTLPSVTVKRDPTTADLRHPTVGGYYTVPTIWSNPLNEKVYVLVSITNGDTANWREVSQGGIAIPVTVPNGGTGLTSLTSGGILLGNGVDPVTVTAQPTDGQLLIGLTGGDPVLATLIAPVAGITITLGPGSITFALSDDLAAVEGLATTGLATRTASNTWTTRTIIGGDGVDVLDGDGVLGNPEISINPTIRSSGGYYQNLGMSYDAGTGVFSITSADGSALSATNPGYVTFQSKSTPGELITLQVIANQSFIDDNGASEIIGNLFGFTTSISVTEDVPFFVYAVMNEDEDAVQFMISRAPGYESSSGGSFIGTPSNPVASTNGSLFSFDDITTTDYDDNPVVMVGSFRMQMSASDDWTVQTLNVVYDGIGQFQENNRFNMPLGQFGANAGTITLDNGGTAPVFSVNTADYRLTKNGYCYYRFNLSGDGGTDGAGGEARIVAPFVIHATSSILTWFPGLYSAAGGNLNLMMAQSTAGSVQQLRLRGDGLATSLTWSLFTNGNRFISATCFYPLFTVV